MEKVKPLSERDDVAGVVVIHMLRGHLEDLLAGRRELVYFTMTDDEIALAVEDDSLAATFGRLEIHLKL